jgi:predicted amidohydrolase
VYRKSHLFAREKHCFDPGDTGFFVVHVPERDLRIGMMICYDWRFPEAARTLALKGADLIVAPSNLVTHIWRAVMPARAVENKVYLAVANRCGPDVNNGEELSFNGQSAIYSYNGDVLASANATEPAVIIAEIEPERTRTKSFNEWNDIFADRRPDLYA